MNTSSSATKIAVVQAAPVLFNRRAAIDKACQLIQEAGSKGAKLVLLPEAFAPAYPIGNFTRT